MVSSIFYCACFYYWGWGTTSYLISTQITMSSAIIDHGDSCLISCACWQLQQASGLKLTSSHSYPDPVRYSKHTIHHCLFASSYKSCMTFSYFLCHFSPPNVIPKFFSWNLIVCFSLEAQRIRVDLPGISNYCISIPRATIVPAPSFQVWLQSLRFPPP